MKKKVMTYKGIEIYQKQKQYLTQNVFGVEVEKIYQYYYYTNLGIITKHKKLNGLKKLIDEKVLYRGV